MTFPLSITKEEINQFPIYRFKGETILVEDMKTAKKIAKELMQEKILGFDTETRASFRKGETYQVSLLQLGTDKKACLFRLNKIPLIPELIDILSNPKIVKAGVAIRDDIKALKKLHPFEEEGFVDLAALAKKKSIKNFGLRALTAIFLSKRLSKKEQTSNWERSKLTPGQIEYASCDSAVGYKIYQEMTK